MKLVCRASGRALRSEGSKSLNKRGYGTFEPRWNGVVDTVSYETWRERAVDGQRIVEAGARLHVPIAQPDPPECPAHHQRQDVRG